MPTPSVPPVAEDAHPHAGTRLGQSCHQRPVLGQLPLSRGVSLLQLDHHGVLTRQSRLQPYDLLLKVLPVGTFTCQQRAEGRFTQRLRGEAVVHRMLILRHPYSCVKSSQSHRV